MVLLTTRDVDELYEVLGALEALAGELAVARMTNEELAEIKAMHYEMALYHQRREHPRSRCLIQPGQKVTGPRGQAGLLAGVLQVRLARQVKGAVEHGRPPPDWRVTADPFLLDSGQAAQRDPGEQLQLGERLG